MKFKSILASLCTPLTSQTLSPKKKPSNSFPQTSKYNQTKLKSGTQVLSSDVDCTEFIIYCGLVTSQGSLVLPKNKAYLYFNLLLFPQLKFIVYSFLYLILLSIFLFVSELFYLCIVDTQRYFSFRCTTVIQHLCMWAVLTTVAPTCHQTTLLQYHWQYSLCCTFYSLNL